MLHEDILVGFFYIGVGEHGFITRQRILPYRKYNWTLEFYYFCYNWMSRPRYELGVHMSAFASPRRFFLK